jgi:glycosyltransferase involved in cell wall biosynthesis
MIPALSIVMCTRNRAPFIGETLRRFEAVSTSRPWELLVVDNGSTDSTAEVLRAFAAQTRLCCRLIHEPQAGASRARNAGWRAAAAEIVAFVDDDCYVAADYVDATLRIFEEQPDLGYLAGQILLHDKDDYPLTILVATEPSAFPVESVLIPGTAQSANMTLKKSVLESIDGFDVALGAGTIFPCEDIDLATRASFAGHAGKYDPRSRVWHHHRRRAPEEVGRHMRWYDFGRGAYYGKCLLHPAMRKRLIREYYWSFRNGPKLKFLAANLTASRFREIRGAIRLFFSVLARRPEDRRA